jgi:pyruvate formate lyase activating enzyme
MKKAQLYSEIPGGVRCDLCARRCVIHEGETGFCRVRHLRDGVLRTEVYGLIDGMAADPVEKKPLFHFAPGSHTFSISTSSCNFRCKFCLNYHSAHRQKPVGRKFSPEEIVKMAEDHDCQGITYTYTEPTIFIEIAHDTAEIAHEEGMYNTFVTNGYLTPEAIDYMFPYLDAASINFKGSGNKQFYRKFMEVPRVSPILDAMEYMKKKGIFIEITNLIIPEIGDFIDDTRRLATWTVENLGSKTPFHLTAFSPTYQITHLPRTPASMIEAHIDAAKGAGLEYVYSGNIPGHNYENTICPNCGFKAIERYSVFLKSNNLDADGTCPKCGTELGIAGTQWMQTGSGSSRFL